MTDIVNGSYSPPKHFSLQRTRSECVSIAEEAMTKAGFPASKTMTSISSDGMLVVTVDLTGEDDETPEKDSPATEPDYLSYDEVAQFLQRTGMSRRELELKLGLYAGSIYAWSIRNQIPQKHHAKIREMVKEHYEKHRRKPAPLTIEEVEQFLEDVGMTKMALAKELNIYSRAFNNWRTTGKIPEKYQGMIRQLMGELDSND